MTATQNTETFIQELSELLDYDSDFAVEFRDTRLNISEAKDFILNGISERLNLPDVKTLAFFLTHPFSYQYHATLFVEIDFNGRRILQIDFSVDENYPEDNAIGSYKLFSEKEWVEARKQALEEIDVSDGGLARFLANPYKG